MSKRLVAVLLVMFGLVFAGPAFADDDEPEDPPAAATADDDGDAPAPAPADDDDAKAGDDTAGDDKAADDKPDDTAADDAKADDDKAGDAQPAAGDADGANDDDNEPAAAKPGDADGDGTPDIREDTDGDGTPDGKEDTDGDGVTDADEAAAMADVDLAAPDADGDGTPDAQEDGDIDNDGQPDAEEEDPPTDPFDVDGDGVLEPEEIEDRKEFAEYFDDIPNEVDDDALDKRDPNAELVPSITAEDFRKGVRIVRDIVLAKMAKKAQKKADQRMAKFSWMVLGLSGCGVFLLLMPLFLKKKYPGQDKVLFKYSGIAALTFFVTVNLFGAVLYGMRTAQGALSAYTNPSVAIASGTFDTLDKNAEDFIVVGKELFLPTLEQMRNNPDEQPSVLLLENGMKIVEDAKVFGSMAKLFKKVDFVFGVLPIVLTLVTLILFILAIRPTLMEIIKLPAEAAQGNASAARDVMGKSMRRVKGEVLATVCTVGVLVLLTFVSAVILGKVVEPALEALLGYFSVSVMYLQFVEGASSGLVFVALFGVILFLVLNLAALILSMSFFLGKSQKIFQARFNDGEPIAKHKRFFQWGVPSVLLVQLFPLGFIYFGEWLVSKINDSLLANVKDAAEVPWGKLMIAGPLVLVVAFAILFWAARGFKAIKFLQSYKVKPKAAKRSTGTESAQPLPPS
jgi:hypothetical protein